MTGSYLAATARERPPPVRLAGDVRADVCVVGGGLTGVSAALRLAADGADVVLLEAAHVGAGASGVSGGQLIPGFRHGAVALVRRFGAARAEALIRLTLAARDRLAGRSDLDCDLRLTGHLTAARYARDLAGFAAEVATLTDLGIGGVTLLDAAETAVHTTACGYHGGLHDAAGGHVHPLNLTLGLAAAARGQGVRVFEESRATAIDGTVVTTPAGRVTARDVVVACDAAVDGLHLAPAVAATLARRMMPVWSYSIATEPLGSRAADMLPSNAAVSDTKFALDYYRRSADDRLLFSGGERYTLTPLADIAGFVRPHLVRAFPQLAGVRIDHAWPGVVAVTTSRFPQVGRLDRTWWAHGYSGHGMLLSQAAGDAIGGAIGGDPAAFDLLCHLPARAWPGGRALRRPLYTAGMVYHAARDRVRSRAA